MMKKFDQMKLLSTGKLIRDDFILTNGNRLYAHLCEEADAPEEKHIVKQLEQQFADAEEYDDEVDGEEEEVIDIEELQSDVEHPQKMFDPTEIRIRTNDHYERCFG